jgi:hypothetical protein
MTKISWLAPVLILWLMGRIASVVVIGWLGSDLELNIDLEKTFFQSTLDIGSIPETSFLDLIAALAVIPLATFTTLAVLGAGSGEPPEWMLEVDKDENQKEIGDNSSASSLVIKGAQTIAAASIAAVNKVAIGDLPQEQFEEHINPQISQNNELKEQIMESVEEITPDQNVDESNLFDPSLFFDDQIIEKTEPSYDEPSISGLEK